jgi:hypothetical protein
MNGDVMRAARIILVAAVFAAFGFSYGESDAAQKPQPQPQVFAPNCAPRPACLTHICQRNGRCSMANRIQVNGCLFYTCKHTAR